MVARFCYEFALGCIKTENTTAGRSMIAPTNKIGVYRTPLKGPLVKGGCHAEWHDWGSFAVKSEISGRFRRVLDSLSQKSKIFASSLKTREPWALPRQCDKLKFEFPTAVLVELTTQGPIDLGPGSLRIGRRACPTN